MSVGKYLLYGVQCVKHEHTTPIQCVYCSELRLMLIICSFCIYALLVFILSQNRCKITKINFIPIKYFENLVLIDEKNEKIWWISTFYVSEIWWRYL